MLWYERVRDSLAVIFCSSSEIKEELDRLSESLCSLVCCVSPHNTVVPLLVVLWLCCDRRWCVTMPLSDTVDCFVLHELECQWRGVTPSESTLMRKRERSSVQVQSGFG